MVGKYPNKIDQKLIKKIKIDIEGYSRFLFSYGNSGKFRKRKEIRTLLTERVARGNCNLPVSTIKQ